MDCDHCQHDTTRACMPVCELQGVNRPLPGERCFIKELETQIRQIETGKMFYILEYEQFDDGERWFALSRPRGRWVKRWWVYTDRERAIEAAKACRAHDNKRDVHLHETRRTEEVIIEEVY